MLKNFKTKTNGGIILKIIHKNKEYNLKLNKIIYVLEKLKGEKIKTKNIQEIKEMMEYFGLTGDKCFLENINKPDI